MQELTVIVDFPYGQVEKKEVTVPAFSTVGSIYSHAKLLFPEMDNIGEHNICIELIDGTFTYADLDKPIKNFQIPEKPRVELVPLTFDLTFNFPGTERKKDDTRKEVPSIKRDPITLTINLKDSIRTIKERISKEINSISPDAFVVEHNGTVLFDALPIPEQVSGAKSFEIYADDTDKKIDFLDLYLRGPVYLPFSDAVSLSAYLLQASVGPSRAYKGAISDLAKYLPRRFQSVNGAAVDLHLEWTFLNSVSRFQAEKEFVTKVQALPLFNCQSFTAAKLPNDTNPRLPDNFELIYTERRIFVLDYIKFKTRLSINYDDVLSIQRDNTTIKLTYSIDGENVEEVRFTSRTCRSIVRKTVSCINGTDSLEETQFTFRTKEDILQQKQTIRPPIFCEDYVWDFITKDETITDLTNANLMHALLIRADSCAWHLSVLLEKVNANTAKVLKDEITAYHSRLIGYLKYLTYDHRPYDNAYKIGWLLSSLDSKYDEAKAIIKDVLTNLALVRQSFVPISKDPIYVTSRNVISFILSHLISCMELPYATEERRVEAFQEIVKLFLENGLELKDLISKYLFSVGDVELKTKMQQRLDYLFRHHLLSVNLFPLITESSQFHDIDPSVILHQDSMNNMMTAMVEFSRVLWEDRKKLPDDHLKEFLSAAADICKMILNPDNQNSTLIHTLIEFNKLVAFNLPGLFNEHRTLFTMINPAITILRDSYSRVQNFSSSVVVSDLLTIAVILVIDQPSVLAKECAQLFQLLEGSLHHVYNQYANDVGLFELDPTEARNDSFSALKCYVQDNINFEVDECTVGELLLNMGPGLALSWLIHRPVSEFCQIFLKLYNLYHWFVHATIHRVLYDASNSEEITLSDKSKEIINKLSVHEASYFAYSLTLEEDLELAHDVTADLENSPMQVILEAACKSDTTLPNWKELFGKPQFISIMVNAGALQLSLTLNSILVAQNTDTMRFLLQFPFAFVSLQHSVDILHNLVGTPGSFDSPRIYMRSNIAISLIKNEVKVLCSTTVPGNKLISAVNDASKILHSIGNMYHDFDLSPLTPLVKFPITQQINSKAVADCRTDMASIMGDYRISKNDFIEAVSRKDEQLTLSTLARIHKSAQEAAELINYIEPDNKLSEDVQKSFDRFINNVSRIWTYRLTALHIRDELENLDNSIDKIVDEVATKMYEPATQEKLQKTIKDFDNIKLNPTERDEFAKKIVSSIKKLADKTQKDDEIIEILYEMLMLLKDNKLYELRETAMTLDDAADEFTKIFEQSKYATMVASCEESVDRIKFIDTIFVWFLNDLELLVKQIKSDAYNKNAGDGLEILVRNIDSSFVPDITNLEIINQNVSEASTILSYPVMLKLTEKCQIAAQNLTTISKSYNTLTETILKNTAFSGNSLIYKDAVLQIITNIYKEFTIQGWSSDEFDSICQTISDPLLSDYSSDKMSKSLLRIRRFLRTIRMHKPNAHPRYVAETEHILNELERTLLESFNQQQNKINVKVNNTVQIIKNYSSTLVKAPNGQIKNFVVRLINNLSMDVSTFRTFEADTLQRGINKLYDSLRKSTSKADHINALIHWLESIERGILPVDVDELLEILKQISSKLKRSEESLFDITDSQMINIAIGLSDALAMLAKIRISLNLIKSHHKLAPIRDQLHAFIVQIMRSLEAYADEIHTFHIESHPVLGIIETAPVMCEKIELLIESGFTLAASVSRHASESIEAIKVFVDKCPEDFRPIIEKESLEPIRLLEEFSKETQI
ncbi:hypothetical protein TVAG_437390 [Trichomonas vaginalis G3]|uniref:Uncharacterized protein n=1 Tax=Trichomonas vaginalis (strain ATCC PRA-98 / G3) TaxID=412133 RepID=A2DFI5_TRIV3|nr:Second domain of FERM family [Trichomonas vaginalis G3]EAY20913.1 hypothetical protein TVAG_437390 [Trichomonas vaginalis G3]KAI5521476.1 Second domain of FERM family [Trichomonas vaginalis G3]|eukprot:XP_001581899.1 hypothetical protein [Trichomonas vaginalis G3]